MELQDLSSRKFHASPVENPAGQQPGKDLKRVPKETAPIDHPPNEDLHGIGFAEQTSSAAPNLLNEIRGLWFPTPIRIRKWWARHISLVILDTSDGSTGGDPRDYLALERTFLAYIRTATALLSLGVIFTQLFLLKQRDPLIGSIFGAITSCGGIVVVLIGCVRYFRQQKLLICGKTISAGWDLVVVWATMVAITVAIFVILLAQD